MSHELPFKKVILGISWVTNSRTSRKKIGKPVTCEMSCEIFTSQISSREIVCPKLKNFRIGPFKLVTELGLIPLVKWVTKTPKKHVFHTKSICKTLKNMDDKNHFQKQIKWSKTFWFDPHMVECTHITFKHVQSCK